MKPKSKKLTYVLALFLGGVGIHHFYLGHYKRGILYLVFSWTYIPIFFGWIDMLFIGKWFEERISIPRKNSFSNNNIKGSDLLSKIPKVENEVIETNKKSNIEQKPLSGNKKSFYDPDIHILPEYAYLQTPQYILEDIRTIQKGTKNNVDVGHGFTVRVLMSGDNFIEESVKNANKQGAPCKHIPFRSYYTQFSDMDARQRNWYFYWRSSVLRKEFLDTDLSYIFLFIYELINFSFSQNAAFNVSMLTTLGREYGDVERYTKKWIDDLLYELDIETYKNIDVREEENDSVYNSIKKYEENYEKIPVSVWKPYLTSTRETVFFSNYKYVIYKVFKFGLGVLDKYYREQDSSLVDHWFQEKEVQRERYLYNGAVLGRVKLEKCTYKVIVRSVKPSMQNEMTAVYKMAENITRGLFNEKRRIKAEVEFLPDRFEERFRSEIDKMYNVNDKGERFKLVKVKKNNKIEYKIPKPPQKKEVLVEAVIKDDIIKFDDEQIESLNKESERLIQVFEESEIKANPNEDEIVVHKKEDEETKKKDIISILDTNDSDLEKFISSLTQKEMKYLKRFEEMKYSIAESNEFFRANGVMAGAFIDTLNVKGYEYLGDIFIEPSTENYEIDEEFEGVLELLNRG